jgi:hypothetical protein
LRVLREATQLGYPVHRFRVAIPNLEQGRREQAPNEHVLSPLTANHSDILCELDPNRETGRGYYIGACFHIYATNLSGTEVELIDGGFTTWTQQLLSNAKERPLISSLGTEHFLNRFGISQQSS